jgi:retron-type reverse transcriptase
MSDYAPPKNRKELYERIARGGRDAVTLEEMIRLGFWSEDRPIDGSGTTAGRVVELRRRLDELRTRAATLMNLEKVAAEQKKQRMAASRQRRLETKQKKLGERAAKKAAWQAKKQTEIVYLGPRVSAGLGPTPDRKIGDDAALAKSQLPKLADAPALAAALGVSIAQLRFLAYDREVSTVTQYRRFTIPKRTGGERLISAPRQRLKDAQHWILEHVLDRLSLSDHAHGFRSGRSIVSNARPHVGAAIVVNADLRDFFPTVTYRRVKGLFRKLGYAEEVATLLALLCTEPQTVETELDGVTYYVAKSERRLPQGAPTSPAITNLLCRKLDRRLGAFAAKHGLTYTRYADDLTISARDKDAKVGAILAVLHKVAKAEGFAVHPDKVNVKRRGGQQEVTGIVVNERMGIDRRTLRRFRTLLFQLEKDGPEGKHWGASGDVVASAIGFANYVFMVDPAKGAQLRERALRLRART